jgi:hypothetical protein
MMSVGHEGDGRKYRKHEEENRSQQCNKIAEHQEFLRLGQLAFDHECNRTADQ